MGTHFWASVQIQRAHHDIGLVPTRWVVQRSLPASIVCQTACHIGHNASAPRRYPYEGQASVHHPSGQSIGSAHMRNGKPLDGIQLCEASVGREGKKGGHPLRLKPSTANLPALWARNDGKARISLAPAVLTAGLIRLHTGGLRWKLGYITARPPVPDAPSTSIYEIHQSIYSTYLHRARGTYAVSIVALCRATPTSVGQRQTHPCRLPICFPRSNRRRPCLPPLSPPVIHPLATPKNPNRKSRRAKPKASAAAFPRWTR